MIIHVVTQEEPGGAQHLAVRLARAHRAAGCEAETWFLYRKHPAFAGEPGVRLLRQERPSPLALPALTAELRSEFRRLRPRAVVAHTHWANLLVPAAARDAGVACRVAVLHSPLHALPWSSRAVERLAAWREAASVRVAVSPSVARPWRARWAPRVIANAAPPRRPGLRSRWRAALAVAEATPLLVAVGRLSPEKGHADLVEALARIPGAHAAIAGDGPLRGRIEQHARAVGVADRLHLLGAVDPDGVADLLAAGDVFVMPSRFEGLSLALLEALQAGIPIIASAVDGNRDALEDESGSGGQLIAPGDIASLTARLRGLIEDPQSRIAWGERARARSAYFSEERMLAAWHGLLGIAA